MISQANGRHTHSYLRAPYLKGGTPLHFIVWEAGRGLGTCVIPPPDKYDWKDLVHPKQWLIPLCPQCGSGRFTNGHAAPGETIEIICERCVVERIRK